MKDEVQNYLAYFKRSWVTKDKDGSPKAASKQRHARSGAYYPTPYALADQYLDAAALGHVGTARPIQIVCTVRDTRGGRGRLLPWLREFAKTSAIKPADVRLGQLSAAGRTVIDGDYLRTMRAARVVVTCNPTGWEGDFRLFEALSSGALVMVDRMGTPYHHPLVDGEHVVYYDHTNKTDLLVKLKHALDHPRWARSVGLRGYRHVLEHHRSVSWVDYILRTAHATILERDDQPHTYSETGDDVLRRTGEAAFVREREHGALHFDADKLPDDDATRVPQQDTRDPDEDDYAGTKQGTATQRARSRL